MNNIMLLSDSYKFSHYKQYPPRATTAYSYLEARSTKVFPKIMFFGLQAMVKKYLMTPITAQQIDYAELRINRHFGKKVFNREGWEHILNEHKGFLPVHIEAVPEGTLVPVSNCLVSTHNQDDQLVWLPNFLETLWVQLWYTCTVATQSFYMKQMIKGALARTGDDSPDFKLHDFGFRGVTCPEQAAIGGAAHLIHFRGTDTFPALEYLKDYYYEDMGGFSIPASEHSTITSWGRDNEADAMANMLEQYPDGMVACVSDSFNIYEACENIWGTKLKDKVLNRDGCLVIRPDSGDPQLVLPAILEILGSKFGYEVNSKGYKVLNPKVRIIQGDGVEYGTLNQLLNVVTQAKWSADNIAFGSGGGLLQKMNRDTLGFAFKASAIEVDGTIRPVYKDPVTDSGKRSKRGILTLAKDITTNEYVTITHDELQGNTNYEQVLKPVYSKPDEREPEFHFTDFATIREVADRQTV